MSAVLTAENMNGLAHGNDSYTKQNSETTRRKLERKGVNESAAELRVKSMRNKRRRKTSDEHRNGMEESSRRSDFTTDGKREEKADCSGADVDMVTKKADARKGARARRDEDESEKEKPTRKASRRLESTGGKLDNSDKAETRSSRSEKKDKFDTSLSRAEKQEIGRTSLLAKAKDSKLEKPSARNEENEKPAGKLEKVVDRAVNPERDKLRTIPHERKRNDSEKMVERRDSDFESDELDNDSDRDLSGSDGEDIAELDRQKAEKSDDLTELERQFRELREALFNERMAAVEERLADVRKERALEFCTPQEALRETFNVRVNIAKQMRKFRADLELQRAAATKRAGTLSIEERRQLALDALREELCAQLRMLLSRAHREVARADRASRTALPSNHPKSAAGKASKRAPDGVSRSHSATESDSETEARVVGAPRNAEDDDAKTSGVQRNVRGETRRNGERATRRNVGTRRRRAKRAARKVDEPFIVYQLSSEDIQGDISVLRAATTRGQFHSAPFSYAVASSFGGSAAVNLHLQTAGHQVGAVLHAATYAQGSAQRAAIPHGVQYGHFAAAAVYGAQPTLGRTPVVT